MSARPITLGTPLSVRELEVAGLLSFAYAKKEIAHQLGISTATVSQHVEHIYKKTGVNTKGLLTIWMVKQGLIDLTRDTRVTIYNENKNGISE